ncbi:MAG: hypothetical protein JWM34_3937 [Ilumatobacteraceae bacterium]|nr:hypothetical protein [Ilumatobacteraceae bacterium]
MGLFDNKSVLKRIMVAIDAVLEPDEHAAVVVYARARTDTTATVLFGTLALAATPTYVIALTERRLLLFHGNNVNASMSVLLGSIETPRPGGCDRPSRRTRSDRTRRARPSTGVVRDPETVAPRRRASRRATRSLTMRHPLRSLTFLTLLSVSAAACASTGPGLSAVHSASGTTSVPTEADETDTTEQPGTTPPDTTAPKTTSTGTDMSVPGVGDTVPTPGSVPDNPADATIDFGNAKTPQPYDDYLKAVFADIQDFWRTTYPQVYGGAFPELTGGIWASYPDRTDGLIPTGCGGVEDGQSYPAQDNAFYCGAGDYVVYDDYQLLPELTKDYGLAAIGFVFAHEFGHAIQARVKVLPHDPVVYREQQADCFSGAWVAHVVRGESPRLKFSDADVKVGLSAAVSVSDPDISEDVYSGDNHGSAFDRVGAFENGFDKGAAGCKQMETDPLPLLDLQFTDATDAQQNGNLPYDEIEPKVTADLTRYWSATMTASGRTFSAPTVTPFDHDGPFPTCADQPDATFPFNYVPCADSNTIFYDKQYAETLYNKYGDFAVAYLLSDAWSDIVQTQLGSSLTGQTRSLIDDCLTGTWTKNIIPTNAAGETGFFISPGDLTEAVETALIVGGSSDGSGTMAGAFERIDNFRSGVIGGISECNKRITGG